jgi:hypothetical protein
MKTYTKDELTTLLQHHRVRVKIRKLSDNSERTMFGTLRADLLPPQEPEDPAKPKRKRTPNPDVVIIYDLEAAGFRSLHPEQLLEDPEILPDPVS